LAYITIAHSHTHKI